MIFIPPLCLDNVNLLIYSFVVRFLIEQQTNNKCVSDVQKSYYIVSYTNVGPIK